MLPEQFAKQVKKSQEPLRRFLVALCCGDAMRADDIAQETLIKAYLGCERLANDTQFEAWLYRIAYNTYLNHLRQERPTFCLAEAAKVSTQVQADDAFKYQDLYIALRQLSDKERGSVLLFYLEGYSVEEIAALTESSVSAVKQQLSRGRTHLRAIILTNNDLKQ